MLKHLQENLAIIERSVYVYVNKNNDSNYDNMG